MAAQGTERRDALRMLAIASAASAFPGFARWSFALAPFTQLKSATYTPKFFSAAEYATLDRLTDLIIPAEDSPGAREAGVAEFIDFMVANDPSLQERFRYGLTWMDAQAQSRYRRPFRRLSASQQIAILEKLAYTSRYEPGQEAGRAFFRLLRDYTVMGFYTTRIGFEELDVPALRTYSESPGCPHIDDPGHRSLR